MIFSLSSLTYEDSEFHTFPFPYLKGPNLVHLCNKVWPQYPSDNQSKWQFNGTLDPNIIRELYNYCEQSGKWKETLYVKAFSYLHFKPSLCTSCSSTQLLLAMKSEQDESITVDPVNKLLPV